MKIAVIGSGYVGLVSGVCFSKIGHEVICVDSDAEKVNKLREGIIPIYEPGLKEILEESLKNQKISFTTDLGKAVKQSQIIFIAVGTPQNESDGSADLSYVFAAARAVAQEIDSYKIIVTKSTVPVGTGFEIRKIIEKTNPNAQFSVASNPEFLREGAAIDDFMDPDRIVIGTEDKKSKELLQELYSFFVAKSAPIVFADIPTAELIKYASNSFLAMKICFINEMADLCEKINGDVKKLSIALGLDSRIGPKFLNPGPGFGGSCFPKDILALTDIARKNSSKVSLIDAIISSNSERKIKMANKVEKALGGSVEGKTIAVFGLAFKGNTDDVRYSPALALISELIKKGAKIKAYDQEAIKNSKKELGENEQISYHTTSYQAAQNADALVIATEWEEFHNLDLQLLKDTLRTPIIVDLRNMLDPKAAKAAGFKYVFVGGKI